MARVSRGGWFAIAAAVALAMFWAALSRRVYHVTIPGDLDAVHVVIRKLYSIVAFTLVGFVADKAMGPSRRRALRSALLVAGLSLLIEIGQKLHHGHEGLASNVLDVGCGALGGWLAVAAQRVRRTQSEAGVPSRAAARRATGTRYGEHET